MPGEGAPHPHAAQKVFSICCLISYISFLKCYCTDISEASCRTIWYVIYCTEPGQFSDPAILSPPFHMRRRHFARRWGTGICGVTERAQTKRRGPKPSGNGSSRPSRAQEGSSGAPRGCLGSPSSPALPRAERSSLHPSRSIPASDSNAAGWGDASGISQMSFSLPPPAFPGGTTVPTFPMEAMSCAPARLPCKPSVLPGREAAGGQLPAGTTPAIIPFSREYVCAR